MGIRLIISGCTGEMHNSPVLPPTIDINTNVEHSTDILEKVGFFKEYTTQRIFPSLQEAIDYSSETNDEQVRMTLVR